MKKGFTLMELLAVIVILAIISLIAIPIILNIIEASRKGAKETSALGYIDAVEKYIITSEVDSEKYPNKLESGKTYCLIENSTYKDKCPDTTIYLNDFIEVKGDKPIDGYVTINGKKNVSTSNLVISDYETICNDNKCKVKDKVKLYFCEYDIGETWDFTNNVGNFTVPCSGNYKIELWGAQGKEYKTFYGGKGAYTTGKVRLQENDTFYLYIGKSGLSNKTTSYNGGGAATGGGGGSTDMRQVNGNWNSFDSLKSRIMVAAGGGGAYDRGEGYGGGNGGPGGTLQGINGASTNHTNGYGYGYGKGGTQTAGGLFYWSGPSEMTEGNYNKFSTYTNYVCGYFGAGGIGVNYQGGGGSGYYGGGGSAHGGAGGGSSFISGYTGCDAISDSSTSNNIIHTGQPNHYSGIIFNNASMKSGSEEMPTHDGQSTMIGNSGDGYAKITYLGN